MTVYVDEELNTFGHMKMSHMCADTESELHAMAEAIGLKRIWFQQNSNMPHYDVSQSKRKLAIEHGTIEIDRRKVVELIRKLRKEKAESCLLK